MLIRSFCSFRALLDQALARGGGGTSGGLGISNTEALMGAGEQRGSRAIVAPTASWGWRWRAHFQAKMYTRRPLRTNQVFSVSGVAPLSVMSWHPGLPQPHAPHSWEEGRRVPGSTSSPRASWAPIQAQILRFSAVLANLVTSCPHCVLTAPCSPLPFPGLGSQDLPCVPQALDPRSDPTAVNRKLRKETTGLEVPPRPGSRSCARPVLGSENKGSYLWRWGQEKYRAEWFPLDPAACWGPCMLSLPLELPCDSSLTPPVQCAHLELNNRLPWDISWIVLLLSNYNWTFSHGMFDLSFLKAEDSLALGMPWV